MRKLKRIYIALMLLILTISICSFEFIFVSIRTQDYIKKVDLIEYEYTFGDRDKALDLAKQIDRQWSYTVSPMDSLLYHDYVDKISNNITKLPILITHKDTTGLLTICKEIKNQLMSLRKSEVPNFENIV